MITLIAFALINNSEIGQEPTRTTLSLVGAIRRTAEVLARYRNDETASEPDRRKISGIARSIAWTTLEIDRQDVNDFFVLAKKRPQLLGEICDIISELAEKYKFYPCGRTCWVTTGWFYQQHCTTGTVTKKCPKPAPPTIINSGNWICGPGPVGNCPGEIPCP